VPGTLAIAFKLVRLTLLMTGGMLRLRLGNRRKGGSPMAGEILWEKELDRALAKAKTEKKPILMDFFNPG
jgi:hypothetical protein